MTVTAEDIAAMPVLSKQAYYELTGYTPHPGQESLHYTPARFLVLANGRRWGKTIFGAKEVEPNAFVMSPGKFGESQRGWIVGPNYTDAEKEFREVYDSLRKLGVDRDSIKFLNNVDSGNMHIRTGSGFDLQCRSAAHPETLVGEGLDFVLMVEAGRHKRKTWGQYIRPTLSDRRGWARFTGVPEGSTSTSLLYALYQRGQDPEFPSWTSHRRPSWTNSIVFPGGYDDPEIQEARSDLTDDEFRRQYGAEFVEKSGSVMKEFEEDVHVGTVPFNPAWPTFMGIDYGFTNPFVVLFIQTGPNGEINVIKERDWTQVDTMEVAHDLLDADGGLVRSCVRMYPDPAEPDDTRTLQRELRIPAYGSTGGPIKTRLALIRLALKTMRNEHLPTAHPERRPVLRIDRSCKRLIWEMNEGYRWPEHRSEVRSDSENPLDKDNHAVEALGRFFKGHYGTPESDAADWGVSKVNFHR